MPHPRALRAIPLTFLLFVAVAAAGTPVDRGTPRQALASFLAAADEGDFADAANLLDLSAVATEKRMEGPRLARRLLLVLLRKGWADPDRLSSEPLGSEEPGLPENRERLASAEVRGEAIELLLQRVPDPKHGQAWSFAPETVAAIDRLYRHFGFGWIGDHLPTIFFAVELLGLQLWQWVALLLIVAVGWAASRLLSHVLLRLFRTLASRTTAAWDDDLAEALDGPLGFVIWAAVIALASPLAGLTPAAARVTHLGWKLLTLVGLGWLLFRLIDVATVHLKSVGVRNTLALSFVPIVRRMGKVTVAALLLLAALDVVGVNVVALLAGFGLGGVAIAFAAQKTLENLFGAIAIAGDRPFKVGDFVTLGSTTGTVEDVGLRSVRVRTLERTVVTIPNGTAVAGPIVNFTERDRMLYRVRLALSYSTTRAQMVSLTRAIADLLRAHPGATDAHCRFLGFAASALEVEAQCWLATTNYEEFLALAEGLNLEIAGVVERSGTVFAFPTQTVHLVAARPEEPVQK